MDNILKYTNLIAEALKNNHEHNVAARNYFTPTPLKIIKKDGKYVGISLREESLIFPELFDVEYRSLRCSSCKEIKNPSGFHWKVKGNEGPFKTIWGKRDSYCKDCRLQQKSNKYIQSKRRSKETSLRRFSSRTLDIIKFKCVIVNSTEDKEKRVKAYNYLLQRIFSGEV